MSKQYYTYLYMDPKTNTPVYIGKGHGYRAFAHFNKTSQSRLSRMLRKRIKEGYDPQPIISYEADETTAHQMEMFWIAFYGRADLGTGTLFNLTDGGEGISGFIPTDETKKKMSLAHIGKPSYERTAEQKKANGAARKGKAPGNKKEWDQLSYELQRYAYNKNDSRVPTGWLPRNQQR